MKVKDLAAALNLLFEGDADLDLTRVAPLDQAGAHDLSFAQGRALKQVAQSEAGCLIVPTQIVLAKTPTETKRAILRAADPRAAAARAINILHPQPKRQPGIHPTAVVANDAAISSTATIGPLATIGQGVRIGDATYIGPGSVIGDRVLIGDRCAIHARVTIYPDVTIGDEAVLHSGCVIGADGFGFVLTESGYEKFPQIGRVEIGNRVEIGANACVDRAALGVTTIGDGTKLDNMVHVGHNCTIGRHVVVAAQTGFSGGVTVGDYAVIGGQVGIGDKAKIESRAVLGSGSGVLTSKIVRAGEVMWGTPARPLKEYLKQLAVLSRLAKRDQSAP
jgi:UDP-3-O-[3-hydroxymyristoyl] glucosamine N-acyltransferase